jgi:hypothetical protein
MARFNPLANITSQNLLLSPNHQTHSRVIILGVTHMKTITTLSALAITAAMLPAFAAGTTTTADEVVAQMEADGYTNISVETSLLGRTEIEGEKDGEEREVVLSKAGEILRDEVELETDEDDD